MKTRKEKILHLIDQRQHQLNYEHEREYLATLLDNLMEKELIRERKKLQRMLKLVNYI